MNFDHRSNEATDIVCVASNNNETKNNKNNNIHDQANQDESAIIGINPFTDNFTNLFPADNDDFDGFLLQTPDPQFPIIRNNNKHKYLLPQ